MNTNWTDKVARSFGNAAPSYDQNALIQAKATRMLCEDLPENALDILEIGCGTGLLTKSLSARYPAARVHATDISPAMIQRVQAQIQNPLLSTAILDAERERTGQHYDLITGNMVCQWFSDIAGSIDNLRSMLGEKGTLALTMPGQNSFQEWKSVLNDLGLPSGMLDFAEPRGVYRREMITQPIESARHFLRSMKDTGASASPAGYTPLSSADLRRACTEFDRRSHKTVTWEILFIRRAR